MSLSTKYSLIEAALESLTVITLSSYTVVIYEYYPRAVYRLWLLFLFACTFGFRVYILLSE